MKKKEDNKRKDATVAVYKDNRSTIIYYSTQPPPPQRERIIAQPGRLSGSFSGLQALAVYVCVYGRRVAAIINGHEKKLFILVRQTIDTVCSTCLCICKRGETVVFFRISIIEIPIFISLFFLPGEKLN